MLGKQKITVNLTKGVIFPLSQYWFVLVYFVLRFLSTSINKFLNVISLKEEIQLITILTIIYCGYAFLVDNETLGANRGYSVVFAVYIYLLGDLLKNKFRKSDINKKYFNILYIMLFGWDTCVFSNSY